MKWEDQKLKKFKEVTPKGNTIEGFICTKPNYHLGSLIIKKINEVDTEQYVQGFPKIHYDSKIESTCTGFEKLDGTNVAIYCLLDPVTKEVIEYIPKSRNKAVLDKNLLSMFKLLDDTNYTSYLWNNPESILYFEMYGIKNLHEIQYINTYLNLKLIGVYHGKRFLNGKELIAFASNYYFDTPDKLFTVKKNGNSKGYKIILNKELLIKFQEYFNVINLEVETIEEATEIIEQILHQINENYHNKHQRNVIEGVVLNGLNSEYEQRYIKIKPSNIKYSSEYALVPNKAIRKEVNKFIDEYGSEVDEYYENDKQFIWDYIIKNLAEEYPIEKLKTKKIEKVFLQVMNAKQVPESVNNIARELVKEYEGYEIKDIMREFAKKYPYRKSDASMVYYILEKIIR